MHIDMFFRGSGKARHFRVLCAEKLVSALCLLPLGGNSWRVTTKVSGRKFPFPELLFARSFHSSTMRFTTEPAWLRERRDDLTNRGSIG